ncbi:MAG: hypothetical protein ABJA98_06450 [Acidobacteriota bacterium]
MFEQQITALVVDPRGETLFAVSSAGLRSVDLATGKLLDLQVHGQAKNIRALAISHDGQLLAGAPNDAEGQVYLWRTGWREWLVEACGRLTDDEVFQFQPQLPAVSVRTSRAERSVTTVTRVGAAALEGAP